ncbi:DUF2235 domain-containing protein [Pseudogemmobacter sonorensis]|uniref:DUF2235 domain-containing protein n=1 Tax=Pseudogemmobacter sonorensis TaxID=2989681 RepID=UPI003F67637A
MALLARIKGWLRRRPLTETAPAAAPQPGRARGRVDHVVILDGTLSSLDPGHETNAGLAWRLLSGGGPRPGRTIYYEEGIQWQGWRRGLDILQGRGIEGQIARAYGHLASHYRAGDRIYLFGYSRGAYAVRSLAGMIGRMGLLRQEAALERNIRQIWRHYRRDPASPAALALKARACHAVAPVEMVGLWDTVAALGLRLPLLWMLTEKNHAFHDMALGSHVRHGFHALALDETRAVFAPVLWSTQGQGQTAGGAGNVEQVWFRGAHADIGGQLGGFEAARPLSNIPLVWMLDRAEAAGLDLPPGWRNRFPCDPSAPCIGTWRGWSLLFLLRRRRRPGRDPSERLHESVPASARARWPKPG